jgi:hypothetical protein
VGLSDLPLLVYRVHWLRSRARFHRWQEELRLTTNEMEWTTRFFLAKSQEWMRYTAGLSAGHIAYAERQGAMWKEMGEQARSQFLVIRPDLNARLHTL